MVQSFGIAMSWHKDRTGGGGCGIVNEALVPPSASLVEPAGSGVAGNNREPGPLVAVSLNRALGFGEQRGRDPAPTVILGDVNLFDLVVDNHHEPGHGITDDRDHGVPDAQ
jgi:hypothetical protein